MTMGSWHTRTLNQLKKAAVAMMMLASASVVMILPAHEIPKNLEFLSMPRRIGSLLSILRCLQFVEGPDGRVVKGLSRTKD